LDGRLIKNKYRDIVDVILV